MNNKMAESKAAFEKAAEGLTVPPGIYLDAELVLIEPITAEFFQDKNCKQRCIVRMKGKLYLSEY